MGRNWGRTDSSQDQGPVPSDGVPPIRLAVGLADPERERALLPALSERGDFAIVERCLAAEQLLDCARGGRVEAILVAFDLHRLSATVLAELARTGVPLVLLAPHSDDPRWQTLPVLPLETDPETVRRALWAAVHGERPAPITPVAEASANEPPMAAQNPSGAVSVIAVAGGQGSPGRTTVALSLAAALGAIAPTVLVDGDLSGPSLAAHLDADPTRGLYMLAHAGPQAAHEWARAIEQETQPISARSRHAVVLCGVPKPEMRSGISSQLFEQLIGELQQRYHHVILDVGADLLGPEGAAHRSALRLAHQVLLVASADLVGLWRARAALGLLQSQLQISLDRVALVVNRYDRRYHHSRSEIEWALGLPSAAVIPFDHAGIQRAIAAQRPIAFDKRSRAGRALLDLAERVHGGAIALPPEPTREGWASRLRLPAVWPQRNGQAKRGAPRADHVAPAR